MILPLRLPISDDLKFYIFPEGMPPDPPLHNTLYTASQTQNLRTL